MPDLRGLRAPVTPFFLYELRSDKTGTRGAFYGDEAAYGGADL